MPINLILAALVAPLLWAIVNHTDKYLVSKYFKGGGLGGLMIFSTFFSIILLPIILFFDQDAFSVDPKNAAILIAAGLANAFSIWLYFKAIYEDESSVIVPFMQLIPVFSFILGYLFLGETLTGQQIIGGLIVIFGVLILSLHFTDNESIKIKKKIVFLMLGHSFLYAIYGVLFKFVSIHDGFWSGAFWESVGLILSGVIFFMVASYREEFFRVFRENSKAVLSLNLTNESLTIAGNWITTYVSLLAPIALVSLVSSYQPLFVFIIGILITVFFPRIGEEDISRRSLIQKGLAIVIVIFGTYLIY